MGCTSWVFSSQACRPVHREGFLIENCVTAPEKVEEQVELELGLKVLKKYMEFTGICWWKKKAFAGFPRQHIAETSITTQVTTPHRKRRSSLVLRCPQDLRKSYKATKNRHMPTKGWSFQQQAEMIWMLKIPERAMESRDKMGSSQLFKSFMDW